MPNYARTMLKLSGNRSYGARNPDLILLVQIIVSMTYRTGLGRGTTVTIYGHLQNMVENLSWSGTVF